jgi:hypothetical protein
LTDVKAHFGSDLVEGPGQEVGGAHPSLEGAKRVFDGLSSHIHRIVHPVEPILHPVEHVLMLPALTGARPGPGSLLDHESAEILGLENRAQSVFLRHPSEGCDVVGDLGALGAELFGELKAAEIKAQILGVTRDVSVAPFASDLIVMPFPFAEAGAQKDEDPQH